VRLAAAGALVGYFAHDDGKSLKVGKKEEEFAKLFYEEEIATREGHRGSRY